MFDTMTRFLEAVTPEKSAYNLRAILLPVIDRMSSQPQNSAGLVIKAGGSTLAKTGSADFYATAQGVLVKISASTDMPALTGLVISANNFNVACFFIDSGGTVSVVFGTQGATIAAMKWPQFPQGKALVGYLLITHSATFTGGTTALDTATTVYVNAAGPFDPTVLV